MIYIIYGLPGSGKSYLAKLLKEQFGFYYWDGDNAVTEEMHACLVQGNAFTQDIRDRFTVGLIKRIHLLKKIIPNENIVISQALYKSSNRQEIIKQFPEARFICVQANDDIIRERLAARKNGLVVNIQNEKNKFEAPTSIEELACTSFVTNHENTDAALVQQLTVLLNKSSQKVLDTQSKNLPTLAIEFSGDVSDALKQAATLPAEEKSSSKIVFNLEITEDNLDANIFPERWLDKSLGEQTKDAYVQINRSQKKAYIYSRSSTLKVVDYDNLNAIFKSLFDNITRDLKQIALIKEDVLEMRNKTKVVNDFYRKFFSPELAYFNVASPLKETTHRIKCFDDCKDFLKENTYFILQLFQHPESKNRPTILHFPGTANARLLYATSQYEARKLALYSGCNVALVCYRLAPERGYPTPLLDAYTAYEYLLQNAEGLALDKEQMLLAGYSSGASITIQMGVVLSELAILPKPKALVLVCPTLDYSYARSNPSEEKSQVQETDRFVKINFMRSAHQSYLHGTANIQHPLVSVANMSDTQLVSLPRIFLFQLENDVFFPQHVALAKRLEKQASLHKVYISVLDHCSWWDNLLPWELLSAWIRKEFGITGTVLSLDTLSTHKKLLPATRPDDTPHLDPGSPLLLDDYNKIQDSYIKDGRVVGSANSEYFFTAFSAALNANKQYAKALQMSGHAMFLNPLLASAHLQMANACLGLGYPEYALVLLNKYKDLASVTSEAIKDSYEMLLKQCEKEIRERREIQPVYTMESSVRTLFVRANSQDVGKSGYSVVPVLNNPQGSVKEAGYFK